MIGLPQYNKNNKCKIRIVCEGYEEEEYINKLNSKAIFSNEYDIVAVDRKSVV